MVASSQDPINEEHPKSVEFIQEIISQIFENREDLNKKFKEIAIIISLLYFSKNMEKLFNYFSDVLILDGTFNKNPC